MPVLAETGALSPEPAPSGSVPCLAERAEEEAPGRSASRISQPRRDIWLRSTALNFNFSYPFFFFLATSHKKKKIAPAWQRLSYCFPDKQRSG